MRIILSLIILLIFHLERVDATERPLVSAARHLRRSSTTTSQHATSRRQQTSCGSGRFVQLNLTLDTSPQETGYRLECDDSTGTYWFVAPGTLTTPRDNIQETACVPLSATCSVTVFDYSRAADGLTAKDGYGYFTVIVDGKVIARYSGDEPGALFQTYRVCFGGMCDTIPALDASEGSKEEGQIPSTSTVPSCPDANILSLAIMFDNQPSETGFDLQCDGTPVWDVSIGSFQNEYAGKFLNKQACVAKASTCVFRIYDHKGDGLSASPYGYFSLVHGATTIAYYRGSDSSDAQFYERTYCFGSSCPEDMPTGTMPCSPIQLSLTLDEFPSDIGFYLTCNGFIIWQVPDGSFQSYQQFETYRTASCVNLDDKCCIFTISDSSGDGLSSPQEKIYGSFDLTVAGTNVAFYDGASDGMARFSTLSFPFGPNCPAD